MLQVRPDGESPVAVEQFSRIQRLWYGDCKFMFSYASVFFYTQFCIYTAYSTTTVRISLALPQSYIIILAAQTKPNQPITRVSKRTEDTLHTAQSKPSQAYHIASLPDMICRSTLPSATEYSTQCIRDSSCGWYRDSGITTGARGEPSIRTQPRPRPRLDWPRGRTRGRLEGSWRCLVWFCMPRLLSRIVLNN